MKHYTEDGKATQRVLRPRADLSIRFLTERQEIAMPDTLPGDVLPKADTYTAGALTCAELRNGAIVGDGSYAFTERDELLRESVDRLPSIEKLSIEQPELRSQLAEYSPVEQPEVAAILGSQRSSNYFHWWIDVMPRAWFVECLLGKTCPMVGLPPQSRFQRESLKLLSQHVIHLTQPIRRFRQLIVSRGLTSTSSQAISPLVVEFSKWCRARMGLKAGDGKQRKLLITREHAGGRRVLNEDEILSRLGPEFERIAPESLSLGEQAELFAQADTVVAPHGAGLTNLLFCTRPTPVVELVHGNAPPNTYRRLARLLGHPYIAIGCQTRNVDAAVRPERHHMVASAAAVATAVDRVRQVRESGVHAF